ncbi:MAG: hypothetical protein R3E01_02405 [Pirellulaceae bacterium]
MNSISLGSHTIELSNPDKVLFLGDGITKADVVAYYRDVAETMLPHLRDRPLMLHRFPDGIGEQGFYQKQIGSGSIAWKCRRRAVRRSTSFAITRRLSRISQIKAVFLRTPGLVESTGFSIPTS